MLCVIQHSTFFQAAFLNMFGLIQPKLQRRLQQKVNLLNNKIVLYEQVKKVLESDSYFEIFNCKIDLSGSFPVPFGVKNVSVLPTILCRQSFTQFRKLALKTFSLASKL